MTVTETDVREADHASGHESDAPGEERTTVGWWIRTIGSWLLLLVLGLVLIVLVVIPRFTGAQTYTVLTGSMEPGISPGALVVVRPTPGEQLRTGDVITFQPYSGNPAVVTHRIVGIFYGGDGVRRFQTQGDANTAQDDWALVPEQVRGTVWFSVPQLGRVNVLLTGEARPIAITVVAGGLIVYAVWMVGSGLRDRSRERRAEGAVEGEKGSDDT